MRRVFIVLVLLILHLDANASRIFGQCVPAVEGSSIEDAKYARTILGQALKEGNYDTFISRWRRAGHAADQEAAQLLVRHIQEGKKDASVILSQFIPRPNTERQVFSDPRDGLQKKSWFQALAQKKGNLIHSQTPVAFPTTDLELSERIILAILWNGKNEGVGYSSYRDAESPDVTAGRLLGVQPNSLPGILQLRFLVEDMRTYWYRFFGTKEKPIGHAEHAKLIETLVKDNFLGPSILSIVSRVKRETVVFPLLNTFFGMLDLTKIVEKTYTPNFVLEDVLSEMAGIPAENLKQLFLGASEQRVGAFVELVLDLGGSRLFGGLEFAPELFKKSELPKWIDYLTYLRDVRQLNGLSIDLLTLVGQGRIVTNLDSALETLGLLRAREVEKMFGGSLKIDAKQLNDLKSRWGNLEPIFTFAARMKDKHRAAFTSLGQIVRAELSNEFDRVKFEGIDGVSKQMVEAQVGFLGPEGLRVWRTPKVKAEYVNTSGDKSGLVNEAKAQFKQALETNLVLHLKDALAESGLHFENRPSNPRDFEIFKTVVEANESSKRTVKQLESEGASVPQIYESLVAVLFDKMEKDEIGTSEVLKALEFIQITRGRVLKAESVGQIGNDITALMNLSKDVRALNESIAKAATVNSYLAITTTVVEAKPLLQIGDMVEATSCQNYRCGFMAYTLPGYVLDANIVATLGFAVSRGNFKSTESFGKAVEVVKNGGTTTYNGNRNTFSFAHPAIGEVESEPVGKAFRRHILRIGKTDQSRPSLRVERPYAQSHNVTGVLKGQALTIIEGLIRDLGADQDSKAFFPRSRNRDGVYSDLGGGAKVGEFTISPQPLSDIRQMFK